MSEFENKTQKKPSPTAEVVEKKATKVNPVITGTVVQRKKSLGKKLAETFTGDDSRSVLDYVLLDVFVPAAKDLMADVITQTVEVKLFGSARSRTRRGSSYSSPYGSSYTPYNKVARVGNSPEPRERDRDRPSLRGRETLRYDEVVLATRRDAEAVISALIDLIERFDTATVANLWDLLDKTGEYTDAKYGWDDLSDADVKRVRDGYLLVFPRPIPVD